jgi:hypothetical protein
MAPGPFLRQRRALAAGLFLLAVAPPAGRAQLATAPGSMGPTPAAVAGRSLLVPGWGQHVLGQKRAWLYLGVEAALWALWADRRSLGSDAREAYRDLAWSEARLATGARTDGSWAYYETLEKWTRSGAWDRDPARTGVQPEDDPDTYNGSIWQRARDLYFPPGSVPSEGDPAYERALAYYAQHAYGEAFLWDWSGKEAALLRYQGLIRTSDDRFRQATTALGAVLANHLLAGVDAWLSARAPAEVRLRVAPGSAVGPAGWTLGVRLRPSG